MSSRPVPVLKSSNALVVREKTVRQHDVRLAPIVISKRLEQTAVQKWDAAIESFAPGFVPAIRRERVVKQRLENIIEEVLVFAVLAARETPQKIVRTRSPILSLLNAEPAFLLDEVKEHDLPHELFGEVGGPNVLLVELVSRSPDLSSRACLSAF